MLSQDWVAHMEQVMKHGQPGDAYEVQHVHISDGVVYRYSGSIYVKTEVGHRSCLLANADICEIRQAPFRI